MSVGLFKSNTQHFDIVPSSFFDYFSHGQGKHIEHTRMQQQKIVHPSLQHTIMIYCPLNLGVPKTEPTTVAGAAIQAARPH